MAFLYVIISGLRALEPEKNLESLISELNGLFGDIEKNLKELETLEGHLTKSLNKLKTVKELLRGIDNKISSL